MKFDEMTDDWVINEIEKIKYTYGLNKVIRYNLTRDESTESTTQSVAEHVYNMLILAHYFRDLEDPEHIMDMEKVTKMILMHDMVEIETGDIVMNKKTEDKKILEVEALEKTISHSPAFIAQEIKNLVFEYDNYSTGEGKFVKAIDKIEQQFWHSVFCNPGMICTTCLKEDRNNNELKRREIYKKCGFKLIEKFGLVIHEKMCQKYPEYSDL